jgi:flagellar hook-associated protein 2
MPSIQSLGVGSGLDASSIISQLLAIEGQPLKRLQTAATEVQTQISAYGTVRAKVDTLGSAAEALAKAESWTQTTVNLNGSDALKVTASGSAEPMDVDIAVTALAQRQSIATASFTSSTNTVGAGTLTIELGSWTENFGDFDAQNPASSVNIAIDGADTLTDIRDKINSANAGVTASILNDASGSRLVLRSQETGEENGFSISADNVSLAPLVFDEASVASRINSHPQGDPDPNPDYGFIGHVRGSNLQATINGAPVSSASNTLTNVLEGVTIQAMKTTAGAAKVNIERDLAGIKSRVESFVSAYNDLMAYVKQQTAYNAETKTAATLQGDRVAVGLQNTLRGSVTGTTAASSVFERLSAVGIELQPDGSLKTNGTKLDTALQNLPEVAALFSRNEAGTSQDGVARRLADLVDELTGAEGPVSTRQESLRARLKRNETEQDKMNDRLALVEARLQAQYTALDTKMASLSGLSQYVSQQVKLLSSSSD